MDAKRENALFQKKGMIVHRLAMELLSKHPGDRIETVRFYQEVFQVSRGTVHSALETLEASGAIQLFRRGRNGTYLQAIDYDRLQAHTLYRELLGVMPLPYSVTYQGFATAIYEQLSRIKFNMAYARGAVARIRLVEEWACQFAMVSRHAAEKAREQGCAVQIARDFGPGSFLDKHVLVFRKGEEKLFQSGGRIAYDEDSLDQSGMAESLAQAYALHLIPVPIQKTMQALRDKVIDIGIWNYDDIEEGKRYEGCTFQNLPAEHYGDMYTSATLIVSEENPGMARLLQHFIDVESTHAIVERVRKGKVEPYY